MLNNLKFLKNLFAIFFSLLVVSILIKYNDEILISSLEYINFSKSIISLLKEGQNIKLYMSILIMLNGLSLFIVGLKINKMENKK